MYFLLLISTVISINGYSGIDCPAGTESVTDLLCDGKANDWVSLGDVP